MKILIFLFLILCIYFISCESDDLCKYNTCGECISSTNDCIWCAQDDLPDNVRRCLPRNTKTKAKWCKPIKSAPSNASNILDKEFNDKVNNIRVQLRPQRMYIKARPGIRTPFEMTFLPAEDYPLDIYYLMDNSFSMISNKNDLKKQALIIYKELTAYTNNVRLGIGSFVEKPAFPYVDENRKEKKHYSYAFKNDLALTTNVNAFISAIKNIQFGGNYDDPESGLDALMQAMLCEKELGWRPGARKIIVLCTDSTYHSAGDGKVIGVIKPNDMKCHLNGNMYDRNMSLTYDYPSVSQINYVARKENFIIVFAVKSVTKDAYIALAKEILGARFAKLEGGNSAVKIIKTVYLERAHTLELDYTFPSYIDLTLEPDCKNKPNLCKSTPEQRAVTISAVLEVKYCPTDGKLKHELEVKAVGLNDKLVIDLDIVCKCDCEEEHGTTYNSKCNYAGVTQCGICKCNPGSHGVDCRCNGTTTNAEDMKKCYMKSDDKMYCSGRGKCRCGECEECNEGYSGKFCEFNDNACPSIVKDETCSGHGRCTLGSCKCDSQWTGDDCSCLLTTSICIAPYSEEICSGNGICKCGKCECNKLAGKNETYLGEFCDTCDDCAEKRCKELEGYVVCNVLYEKKLCDEKHNTNNTVVTFLNKTEFNGPEWEMAKWCRKQLQNESYVIFKYQYVENKLELGIQNETELPNKANVYVAVGSAIGIALLIGIITLIVWKILIDIHDKREYKKFIEEAESAGYQNVLYVPPTQQFSNPAFDKD